MRTKDFQIEWRRSFVQNLSAKLDSKQEVKKRRILISEEDPDWVYSFVSKECMYAFKNVDSFFVFK
ncbi:hypothetical protein DLM75_20385 [Leptospira stimsonii]|uniref:Uncharacterized protein n=1 Tax=Leptospira stimsonii TaxID=2202203 RepID=A0A396YSK1_9LEPT|nr:hypothetical protein DLM75_20385 [Leptospira stimsonii]